MSEKGMLLIIVFPVLTIRRMWCCVDMAGLMSLPWWNLKVDLPVFSNKVCTACVQPITKVLLLRGREGLATLAGFSWQSGMSLRHTVHS